MKYLPSYFVAPSIIPGQRAVGVTYNQTRIIVIVSEYLRIPVKDMMRRTRARPIVEARQIAMFFLKSLTGDSLTAIGLIFNRDHTTIIHAIQTVRDLMETNSEYRKKVQHISRLITPQSD